jgi:hypothetical protein
VNETMIGILLGASTGMFWILLAVVTASWIPLVGLVLEFLYLVWVGLLKPPPAGGGK